MKANLDYFSDPHCSREERKENDILGKYSKWLYDMLSWWYCVWAWTFSEFCTLCLFTWDDALADVMRSWTTVINGSLNALLWEEPQSTSPYTTLSYLHVGITLGTHFSLDYVYIFGAQKVHLIELVSLTKMPHFLWSPTLCFPSWRRQSFHIATPIL